MKKLAILCLATLIVLCSCTDNGQKELKKADAAFSKHLYTEAASWYEKAAKKGLAEAQYELGSCYEYGNGVSQDIKQAEYWYEKAAEQGHAEAQYKLGVCYAHGDGVSQDIKQAAYWWEKAAGQGDAEAQFCLGMCYEYGNGVNKDYKKAVSLYKQAAAKGFEFAISALVNLGEELPEED